MLSRASLRGPLALVAAVVLLGHARTAAGHPAGVSSVNRYLGVACDAEGAIHLSYLLDFAELPSYSEFERLDANHDETVTPEEQRAYLGQRLAPLVAGWTVTIDGVPAALRVVESHLQVTEAAAGPSTLRIAADVVATPLPEAKPHGRDVDVDVRDPGFSDHPGWRELAGEDSADSVVVQGARESRADALAYGSGANGPSGGREPPPRTDEARFTFRRLAVPADGVVPLRPAAPTAIDPRLARLSSAMKRASGSPVFSAFALGLALFLGAIHALSPGHGKALAAAYLVGTRSRPSQALVFGTTVTAAHTAVVFLLGCMALTIERTVGEERIVVGLELGSALAVVLLGLGQLSKHWRQATSGEDAHEHGGVAAESKGLRSVAALGVSAGLTPCPSALAILLSAIALHRYGFGLVLVVAFSFGVAITLTTTGLLVVAARGLLDRMSGARVFLRWLPVLSSACVLVFGVLLCASAWR